MKSSTSKSRFIPAYTLRLFLASICLLPLWAASATSFQPNDEVKLTRDVPLLFSDKPFRQGSSGETFKVLACKSELKKVYLAAKDSSGKPIAVSVSEDALALVPADKAVVQTSVLSSVASHQLDAAKSILNQALRTNPDDVDLHTMSYALDEVIKSAQQLNQCLDAQKSVEVDLKRRRRNADVTDHTNALDPSDHSGQQRAQTIRAEATELEVHASQTLRIAQTNYDATLAALKAMTVSASSQPPSPKTSESVVALPRTYKPMPQVQSNGSNGKIHESSNKGEISNSTLSFDALVNRNHARAVLISALREAENIKDVGTRAVYLEDIAVAQAEADDVAAAESTIMSVADAERRDTMRVRIPEALVKAGDLPGALCVADALRDDNRSMAYVGIVRAQTQSGDVLAARQMLAKVTNNYERGEALQEIASAEAKAGDVPTSLKTAAGIRENNFSKDHALHDIAAAQADSGDVSAAVKTALSIEEQSWKAHAFYEIAGSQVRHGDLGAARRTVYAVQDVEVQPIGLAGIAEAQAQTGDVTGALRTTGEMLNGSWEDIALNRIAVAQVKAGDLPGALSTALRIPVMDKGQFGDAMTYIATSQAKAGDVQAALQTIERIEADRWMQPAAFAHVAAMQVLAGATTGAEKTLDALEHGERKVSGYVSLARVLIDETTKRSSEVASKASR